MRARMTAIAAATCALALLPAASAVAGTGPDPAPHKRQSQSKAPSSAGNPLSTRARTAGVCSDAYEIGDRGVIYRKGNPIGSVKQFYSPDCNENYGYLWVWDKFRNTHAGYDVSIGVHSYDRGYVVGERTWLGTHGQEFWSGPANTTAECTSALGTIRSPQDPIASNAWSSERC